MIQAFSPLSTQKSPSRRAVVFRLPASLPAPGSVRPKPPTASPVASAGSTFRFSSSLPKWTIGQQQTELVTLIVTATAGIDAGDLLDGQQVGEGVGAGAAVLLGDQHAEQPHLPHLLEDVGREDVLAVALRGPGLDALDGEAAHLVAEELLVLGEREVDAGAAAGGDLGRWAR